LEKKNPMQGQAFDSVRGGRRWPVPKFGFPLDPDVVL
jgi:hypothetical protein